MYDGHRFAVNQLSPVSQSSIEAQQRDWPTTLIIGKTSCPSARLYLEAKHGSKQGLGKVKEGGRHNLPLEGLIRRLPGSPNSKAWSCSSTSPSYLSMRSSFSFRRCSLLFKMLIHCAGSKVGSKGAKAAGWWQTAPFWSWKTNRPAGLEPDHRYLGTPQQYPVRIGSQGLVWLCLIKSMFLK